MVCRLAVTCQWRCDRTTEYHQIKNNSLRFSPVNLNCILRFYDSVFGGRITIKIIFSSFETIYRFERTILKIRVL